MMTCVVCLKMMKNWIFFQKRKTSFEPFPNLFCSFLLFHFPIFCDPSIFQPIKPQRIQFKNFWNEIASLSLCLFVFLFVCLSVCLSLCLSVSLALCLSVCHQLNFLIEFLNKNFWLSSKIFSLSLSLFLKKVFPLSLKKFF